MLAAEAATAPMVLSDLSLATLAANQAFARRLCEPWEHGGGGVELMQGPFFLLAMGAETSLQARHEGSRRH